MTYYSYEDLKRDTKNLTQQVCPFQPDTVVAIARGGMMLGQLMGYGLDIRNVQSIHVESYDDEKQREHVDIFGSCDLKGSKRVLVVDDIVDSGNTMKAILEHFQEAYPQVAIKSASLFYKPTAVVQPDFTLHEANDWINFFWEVDFA